MALEIRSFFAPANPPKNPDQVFLRQGSEFYGEGVALRLSAKGENRIAELSRAFQDLGAKTVVDDQVKLPGSGLFGFVSITFSAESEFESAVVIPARLTVIRDGVSFVTEFASVQDGAERTLPSGVFLQG